MRRRTERVLTSVAFPLALLVNIVGMIAFVGVGLHPSASASSSGRATAHTPSPSPTAPPTSTPSATMTPSATPEPQMDGYVTRTYFDPSGATMTYYLHIPSKYDPSQSYPLVLLLHGTGEAAMPNATPRQNASLLLDDSYVKVWSGSSVQSRWPSFILVPQVVVPSRWTNARPGKPTYTLLPQPEPSLQMVMDILASVQAHYSINPQRIYLTGISMGGDGSWEAAERWPTVFAAVVPVAGAGDPTHAADLVNVPVWAFQSAEDRFIPISASVDMIGAIKSAGGHPCFTKIPGNSHDLSTWMTVYTSSAMLKWLFAQGTTAATAPGMQHCSA